MKTLSDFVSKQSKYMLVFPKANGKPTIYIEGYPYEDDEPMSATGFHGEQINTLSDQFWRYFAINPHIHIGVDNFIYYREGDMKKFVVPDIYVVLGAAKYPLRRSFYTWAEGAVPAVVFEFLSDATANRDRQEKVELYLREIGIQEYFIHQPELDKPAEFRGWRRNVSGDIVEMVPDAEGGLFSEALNLYFRWEVQLDTHTRLLRPYLPDGTRITTSREEEQLRVKAETLVDEETARRQEAETLVEEEAARRREAEMLAAAETARRQEVEVELERLRAQLAERQD